jgi:hypothetical protein
MKTVTIAAVKIAFMGAFFYIAFFFCLRVVAVMLAKYKGSVGIDLSRPMLFILSLSMWAFAFSVAYWILNATRR